MTVYKCDTCGNIITKIIDSKVVPSCCGSPMTKLTPESTDGALERHVPVYKRDKNMIFVSIGEEPHPMTDQHHIEFVILETTKGFHLHYLYKGNRVSYNPNTSFCLSAGEEPLAILGYCNIHGLYLKECSDLMG